MKKRRNNAKVLFRRRRQSKTNYLSRIRALKAGRPRLVVRRTNRYLIAQIVVSEMAQDKVVLTANSKDLIDYGWPETTSVKNLAAGYLLGILCAVKAKKAKIDYAALDIGLLRSTKGNRIYAVVKGAVDGGLDVPHSAEILPPMERIKREDLKNKVDVDKIKEKILKNA